MLSVLAFAVSGQSQKFPKMVTPPAPPLNLVQEMLELSNQARQKNGAPPLVLDARLNSSALQHSDEMDRLGYFGHTSPVTAFAQLPLRMVLQNCYSLSSAENLSRFQGYTAGSVPEATIDSWMNSPVHRKNLLNPSYNRVGYGVSRKGDQFTITQNLVYLAVDVTVVQVRTSGSGFSVNLDGKVADGPDHGVVLRLGKRVSDWKADSEGKFAVQLDMPGSGDLDIGQAAPEGGWTVEATVAVDQAENRP